MPAIMGIGWVALGLVATLLMVGIDARVRLQAGARQSEIPVK